MATTVQWLFNGKLLIEDPKSNEINQLNSKSNRLQSKIELNGQSNLTNSNNNNLSNKIHYNNLQSSILPIEIDDYDKSSINRTLNKNWSLLNESDDKFLQDNNLNGDNNLRRRRSKRLERRIQINENIIQLPNVSISGRSLLIRGASAVHSGNVMCIADNGEIGQSDSILLHVHFIPRCADNQPIQYVLKSSQTASISCEIDADPIESINFHWLLLSGNGELTNEIALNSAYENYHSKQSIVAPFTSFYHHFHNGNNHGLGLKDHRLSLNLTSPNIQFTTEYLSMNNSLVNFKNNTSNWQSGQPQANSLKPIRVRSLAKYTPTQNTHYGILQCYATNAIGIQKQPCTYFVLAAQAPDPPVNCTTTNVTISTLTVECVPG